MFKPLLLNSKEVVWSSDLHHGHAKPFIYEKRGAKDIAQHDDEQLERINARGGSRASLIHLGDIILGADSAPRLKELLGKLNYYDIYLLPGNHFSGLIQMYNEYGARFQVNGRRVIILPNYAEFVVCGQPVVTCHYPLAAWNGESHGAWHFHGHCHGNLAGKPVGDVLYNRRCLDVGMDNFPNGVSFDDASRIFQDKTVYPPDHH